MKLAKLGLIASGITLLVIACPMSVVAWAGIDTMRDYSGVYIVIGMVILGILAIIGGVAMQKKYPEKAAMFKQEKALAAKKPIPISSPAQGHIIKSAVNSPLPNVPMSNPNPKNAQTIDQLNTLLDIYDNVQGDQHIRAAQSIANYCTDLSSILTIKELGSKAAPVLMKIAVDNALPGGLQLLALNALQYLDDQPGVREFLSSELSKLR